MRASDLTVRVARTRSGRCGLALHEFNPHTESWEPRGKIFTGLHKVAEARASRAELIADEVAQAIVDKLFRGARS